MKGLQGRPDLDYRNSIKESISTVEALYREITGESILGPTLKAFDSKTGIRHALMDEVEVPTFDEVKFMLVNCCAFVNFSQGKRN